MLTNTEQLMTYVVFCTYVLEKFKVQNKLIVSDYNGASVMSWKLNSLRANVCDV